MTLLVCGPSFWAVLLFPLHGAKNAPSLQRTADDHLPQMPVKACTAHSQRPDAQPANRARPAAIDQLPSCYSPPVRWGSFCTLAYLPHDRRFIPIQAKLMWKCLWGSVCMRRRRLAVVVRAGDGRTQQRQPFSAAGAGVRHAIDWRQWRHGEGPPRRHCLHPFTGAAIVQSIGGIGDKNGPHGVAKASIRLQRRRARYLLETLATKRGCIVSRMPPSVCGLRGRLRVAWANERVTWPVPRFVAACTVVGRLRARPQKVPGPRANGQPHAMLGDAGLTPASPSREWPAPGERGVRLGLVSKVRTASPAPRERGVRGPSIPLPLQ